MDKYLVRKDKPTAVVQGHRPSSSKRYKSSVSKATTVSSLKTSHVPQAPFLSSAVSRANRKIDSTLADHTNPITHNDSCRRTQHVVSAATGHQQSNGRSGSSIAHYNTTRLSKLRVQAKASETDILRNVVIYINGYTGEVRNQALIGMIQTAGGQIRPVLSAACTHIVTTRPLSAKKSQAELDRRRGGPRLVKPEWVLDSIKLGKRQAEWKYPVEELETQARIASVFENACPSVKPSTKQS